MEGRWQGQQGSNPRPAVLETAALPTELYPYRGTDPCAGGVPAGSLPVAPFLIGWRESFKRFLTKNGGRSGRHFLSLSEGDYSTMLATMPAPTVRPPSRMAKRRRSSMAIGTISSTSTVTLSPGITISVPAGSVTMPVTSVVRK